MSGEVVKRTSNGMERKGTPSGEKFVYPQPAMVPPKYEASRTTWWDVQDRAEFRRRQAIEQERMQRVSISIPHKDAIDR